MQSNHRASLTSFAAIFIAGLTVSACGSTSTVQLGHPTAPPSQAPAKPGQPTEPTDGRPTTVQPTPVPTPFPLPSRLRLVCEYGSLGKLQTITTLARAVDIAALLTVENVVDARGPIPLQTDSRDVSDVLFEGARESTRGSGGPRRLFLGHVDLSLRQGTAQDLGSAISVDSSLELFSDRTGLKVRNYGVSDLGNFLLLPGVNGLSLVSRATLMVVGTLNLKTATTVLPQYFENEGLFTALVYSNGQFRTVVKRISLNGSAMTVQDLTIPAAATGRSAFQAQWLGPNRLVWAEAETGSSATPFSPSSVQFVTYDATQAELLRIEFQVPAAGSVLSPHIAVIGAPQAPRIVTVFEKITPYSNGLGMANAKIEAGFEIQLELTSGHAAEIARYAYPQYVIDQSTANGIRGPFDAKKILAPTGASEAILSLSTLYGDVAFKTRSGILDSLGQDDCKNPGAVQEAL